MNWVVAAAAQAHEQLPQLTLDIYGKGTEEENLKDQIKRLGVYRLHTSDGTAESDRSISGL